MLVEHRIDKRVEDSFSVGSILLCGDGMQNGQVKGFDSVCPCERGGGGRGRRQFCTAVTEYFFFPSAF